jgi:hypothetical protein
MVTLGVRQEIMKRILTALALSCIFAARLPAQSFNRIQNCNEVSAPYRHIAVGTSLSNVTALVDTPLPKGLYWPEHQQKDGAVITKLILSPPKEWGTNYVQRIDCQSRKRFFFFHDSKVVVQIVWSELRLTSDKPRGPRSDGSSAPPFPKPIGPLIMIEQED